MVNDHLTARPSVDSMYNESVHYQLSSLYSLSKDVRKRSH